MSSITRATVNLAIQNNATWADAFQFGTPGDLTWSLTGMSFSMDVKASKEDLVPLMTLSTGNGYVVVLDPINRIVQFNVPDSILQALLPPATYVYDLVMSDTSTPPIRTPLMGGKLHVTEGVTLD